MVGLLKEVPCFRRSVLALAPPLPRSVCSLLTAQFTMTHDCLQTVVLHLPPSLTKGSWQRRVWEENRNLSGPSDRSQTPSAVTQAHSLPGHTATAHLKETQGSQGPCPKQHRITTYPSRVTKETSEALPILTGIGPLPFLRGYFGQDRSYQP